MHAISRTILGLTAFASAAIALSIAQVDTRNWKSFSTKDGSFTLKTPMGWGLADSNDQGFKDAVVKIKANNPHMAKMMEGASGQYDLMIYDLADDPTDGMNNFNLKTIKDSVLTTREYPDLANQILSAAKMTNAGWKVIDLPCGKTLSYWGDLNVDLGGGTKLDMSMFGYVSINGSTTYIYTFATTKNVVKTQKPIIEAMAKSVTLR